MVLSSLSPEHLTDIVAVTELPSGILVWYIRFNLVALNLVFMHIFPDVEIHLLLRKRQYIKGINKILLGKEKRTNYIRWRRLRFSHHFSRIFRELPGTVKKIETISSDSDERNSKLHHMEKYLCSFMSLRWLAWLI